jgi:hypothetical protein
MSSDLAVRPDATSDPGPLTKRFRGGWIVEIAAMLVLYELYDRIRTAVRGSSAHALANAKQIASIEQFIGLYHERTIQDWFLPYHVVLSFWNFYHGTIHFVLPVFALVWMYRKAPVRYVRWRNAFLFMLGLGLLGAWLYPLMPPAYMPEPYRLVNTEAEYYNFGPQQKVEFDANGDPSEESISKFGNLYAGMPSLHVAWAVWAVFAIWPMVRRRWVKWLLILHLVLTGFTVTVTGQHRLVDIPAGVVAFAVAYAMALGVERALRALRLYRRAHLGDRTIPPTETVQVDVF